MIKRLIKGLKQKLQWQYFASYLALLLVTLGVFFAFTFNSFYRFHTRNVMDNYQNRLGLIRDRQEAVLRDLVSIAGQVMNVTSVTPFDYREEPEKGTQMIEMLTSYRSTHDTLYGIYLHFYGDAFVYGATGFYTLERFVDQAVCFDGMTGGELVARLESASGMTIYPMQTVAGYGLQYNNEKGYRMVAVFLPVSVKNGARCGTALFLLAENVYNDWFANLGTQGVEIHVMQRNTPIASQRVTDIPMERILEASAAGESAFEYGGARYHLLEIPGGMFELRYLMVIPQTELEIGMKGSMQMLMVLTAVSSALGILFIHYFVQRRMRPIKLLHTMICDREPTDNELIEIRDGVQRLIEENRSMTTQIENTGALRRSDFVRRFLTGAFESMDECLAMAEACSLNVDMRCFAVAMIAKPADSHYELTVEKLNRLFGDEVSGAARSMASHQGMVLLAFANDPGTLRAFFEGKFAGLRACCAGVTMAVSAVHGDSSEGQRAYLEAENAFEMRFVRGNAKPIYFDELDGEQGESRDYSKLAERLRASLHAGDAARVNAALCDISAAVQGMSMTLFGFRCLYNDILNAVSREAQRSGMSGTEVYDLFKLGSCLSVDDLDAMLRQVCSHVLSGRPQRAPQAASEEMTRARAIIERRFSEPDLSVGHIAAELGMSDSKLSIEFKKAYHITPLECITGARMHRARRLLLTTEMPVKDIALECGYYDISSFNRRFKAYTGMTPQQYKLSGQDTEKEDNA